MISLCNRVLSRYWFQVGICKFTSSTLQNKTIRFRNNLVIPHDHLPKFSCLYYEYWWRYVHRREVFFLHTLYLNIPLKNEPWNKKKPLSRTALFTALVNPFTLPKSRRKYRITLRRKYRITLQKRIDHFLITLV